LQARECYYIDCKCRPNHKIAMLKSAAKVDCCILVVGDDRDYDDDDDDDIHNLFPCEQHMTTMKMTMPGLVQGQRSTADDGSNDKHDDDLFLM